MKIGEIDHNGAYLCESKHIRILILHHLILKSVLNRHKAQLKKCEKQWRLFCFVFAELNNFVNFDEIGHFDKISHFWRDRPWKLFFSHFNQAKLFNFNLQHLYILHCLSSKMLLLWRAITEPSFSITFCVIHRTEKYSVQRCLSYFTSLNSWRCWSQSWSR